LPEVASSIRTLVPVSLEGKMRRMRSSAPMN
jgi:hypothetical protein